MKQKEMERKKVEKQRQSNCSSRKHSHTHTHKWNSWGPVRCFRSKVFKELCVEVSVVLLPLMHILSLSPILFRIHWWTPTVRTVLIAVSGVVVVAVVDDDDAVAVMLWLNHAYHRLGNGNRHEPNSFGITYTVHHTTPNTDYMLWIWWWRWWWWKSTTQFDPITQYGLWNWKVKYTYNNDNTGNDNDTNANANCAKIEKKKEKRNQIERKLQFST